MGGQAKGLQAEIAGANTLHHPGSHQNVALQPGGVAQQGKLPGGRLPLVAS